MLEITFFATIEIQNQKKVINFNVFKKKYIFKDFFQRVHRIS